MPSGWEGEGSQAHVETVPPPLLCDMTGWVFGLVNVGAREVEVGWVLVQESLLSITTGKSNPQEVILGDSGTSESDLDTTSEGSEELGQHTCESAGHTCAGRHALACRGW